MRHAPPAMVFAAVVVLALASFVPAALVIAGVGRSPAAEPGATSPSASSPRSSPTASARTSPGGAVRVVSGTGSSRPIAAGQQHEVTFQWHLEGAHEGDDISVQVYAGNRPLGQTRGSLDPTVFSFSTGVFRLTATLDCSTNGWSAEILTVRGQPIAGSSEAAVPGVTCP